MVSRSSNGSALLSRLPGVGEKTAQRYVLFLLTADEAVARDLGAELVALHDVLRPCARCGNVAEVERRAAPPYAPFARTRNGTRRSCAWSRACTISSR